MNNEDFKIILDNHQKWLNGEEGGVRANLARTNLEGANLERANLARTNLEGANLERANLAWTNLWGARGNNKQIKSLHITPEYNIAYTIDRLQIG